MIVKSAAKLNLTLDILGLLPGGYHAIETVFQNIDILDTLEYSFDKDNSQESIRTRISLGNASDNEKSSFPLDDDNLIAKSARIFAAKTGLGNDLTVDVEVTKTIPIAAGMAGGSGNAAATLVALNEYFQKPLSKDELCEIGASLGSDVSFFIHGGTCAGSGRGEILKPISHNQELSFLIVKPKDIAISTPWIYKEFDKLDASGPRNKRISNLSACEKALYGGDKDELCKSFSNDFEAIVYKAFPEVDELRKGMLALGCLSSNISGSGPTLYGLTRSTAEAGLIKREFEQWHLQHKTLSQVKVDIWAASSINFGTSIVVPN